MNKHDTPRKFAAFDIDGTLFRSGLYREVATELMNSGTLDEEKVKCAQEKFSSWERRESRNSYEEFEGALVEALDSSLPNIPTEVYDTAVEKVTCEQLDNVYTYTREELRRLGRAGYFLVAISGSQNELVEPFAKKYNFDTWIGQSYIRTEDGTRFTGEAIKTYTGKDAILSKIIEENNLTTEDSYAFGDSAGDRGMLQMVDHPVAFNPTIELMQLADENGWPIVIERKSVVYEMKKNENGLYILEKADKL